MAENLRPQGMSDVIFETLDGNLKRNIPVSEDTVTAILFDISKCPDLFKKGYGKENIKNINEGDVVHIETLTEAVELYGIKPRVDVKEGEQEEDVNFMYGLPYYHIRKFFLRRGGEFAEGSLYVMFADCSKNWDAINVLQNSTGGLAHQIGVYTEQSLWGSDLDDEGNYSLRIVRELQDKATQLQEEHQPAVIILHANTAKLEGVDAEDANKISLDKIPSCLVKCPQVAIVMGQANTKLVNEMQLANPTHSPVGVLGDLLGALTSINVGQSIAWVGRINLFDPQMMRVEFGFGDTNLNEDGNFISTNMLESIPKRTLDKIVRKGYNFVLKYAGEPNGVHFSSSGTCDSGDFRKIEYNRTIQRARRGMRKVLLPKLNSPVLVNRADGTLTASTVTEFTNLLVDNVFGLMFKASELSGYNVYIDPKQKILETDSLTIEASIVPLANLHEIRVKEKLVFSVGRN